MLRTRRFNLTLNSSASFPRSSNLFLKRRRSVFERVDAAGDEDADPSGLSDARPIDAGIFNTKPVSR